MHNDLPHLSRRSFLSSLAAAAGLASFPLWLRTGAFAQPTAPLRMRYEASSPNGRAMLTRYARAIGIMNDESRYPLHHPASWRFQADIHRYPPNEGLDTRIFKLNGDANDAVIKMHRKLALGSEQSGQVLPARVFATCPHHTSKLHFLPWHRLYLAYFEQTIEKVLGEPFALPYWNYLDPAKRKMPDAFRSETVNGAKNWLYFDQRTRAFVEQGLVADGDETQPNIVDALKPENTTELLRQLQLLNTPRRTGFSDDLEGNLHDQVHGAIGTALGMGVLEYAARDPIFWLHHANIDRIWESWRNPSQDGKSGRDPAAGDPWRNENFRFASAEGEGITHDVSFALFAASNLNYRYDVLEPMEPRAFAAGPEVPPGPPTNLGEATSTEAQTLRGAQDRATLRLRSTVEEGVARGFAANPSSRYELAIQLNAAPSPGLYQVFVRAPSRPGEAERPLKHVGTFTLLTVHDDAGGHGDHADHEQGPVDTVKTVNVTRAVEAGLIKPADGLDLGDVVVIPSYLQNPIQVTIKSVSLIAK